MLRLSPSLTAALLDEDFELLRDGFADVSRERIIPALVCRNSLSAA